MLIHSVNFEVGIWQLRVSENRMLRRIDDLEGEDYIMRSFITSTLYQVFLGR